MFIKNFDVLARDYLHRVALQLIEYGLAIADPYNAVKSSLKVFGDRIFIM